MRPFTLFAAALAVVFGLASAPALADSFSFSYSTGPYKSHYGGSGYKHGYIYGKKYGYKHGYGHGFNKPYFGRSHGRYGQFGFNPYQGHKFGSYKHGYKGYGYKDHGYKGHGYKGYGYKGHGYGDHGYHKPQISTTKLIKRLKRQHFHRIKRIHFANGYYSVFARDYYGRKVKLRVDSQGRVVGVRYLG